MNDIAGIRYSAVHDDVERIPGKPRIDEARLSHVSPDTFARSIVSSLSLVPLMDTLGAPEFNKRLIAIAAFAAENPEWTMNGRCALREYEDGVVMLSPSQSPSGSWGFSAKHSHGAALSEIEGRVVLVPLDATFETSVSAIDLGDSLAKLKNLLDLDVRGPGIAR